MPISKPVCSRRARDSEEYTEKEKSWGGKNNYQEQMTKLYENVLEAE